MSGPGFVQGVPNFDKLEIVVMGYETVTSGGSPTNWNTVAHNLGFRPIVMAFLNNVSISSGGTSIFSNGDVPLPAWYDLSIDTTNHVVNFQSYLNVAVDNANVYFLFFNSTGRTYSIPVKYYLLRERTA